MITKTIIVHWIDSGGNDRITSKKINSTQNDVNDISEFLKATFAEWITIKSIVLE